MIYTLLDEFFSKKEVELTLKEGDREVVVKARKAKGGCDVYADSLGQIITGYWLSKVDIKPTPFQRAAAIWRPEEKRWIVFDRGFVSAWRSRCLALYGARQKRLPQLLRVEKLVGDIRHEISLKADVPPELKRKLWQTGFLLTKPRKPATKEAQAKIFFLYRDVKMGLNIGALLARTTAIADRLKERLHGIYSWVSVYSGQSNFLESIQMRAKEIFSEIKTQIALLQKNEYFSKDSVGYHYTGLLVDKIACAQEELEKLKPLRPYAFWAAEMIEDLRLLDQTISDEDRTQGKLLVARLYVSLRIKQEQRELDKFLLLLGEHQIIKKYETADYLLWFDRAIKTFGFLKKLEKEVQFRRPVCGAIIKYLYGAKLSLKEKSLLKIREQLAMAYRLF